MCCVRYSFPAFHASFQNCACVIAFLRSPDIACTLGGSVRPGDRSSRVMLHDTTNESPLPTRDGISFSASRFTSLGSSWLTDFRLSKT
jgi:hypothetical protein